MPSMQTPSPPVAVNENVSGLHVSATLAINERSHRLQAAGRQVYRLGLGQSPFPVPEHVRESLARNAHRKDYLQVKGLPALREAVVEWIKRTEHLDYSPDNVLVGPGTKELHFLVQLVYRGELVIPAPSWVSYAPQAKIIGRPTRWLETRPETGHAVEPQVLDALCRADPGRPRLLILNSPCNPTGHAYHEEQLRRLAETLRKYRVLVLSDEIYSGTHFDAAHQSLARYYPEGAIISNGLSKWCGAGGWRVGFFVFPDTLAWLADAVAAVASETYTSTSAPLQYAAISALEDRPEMAQYLDNSRRVLAHLATYTYQRLRDVGAALTPAAGGFYLMPHFEAHRDKLVERGISDGDSLCESLLDDIGVATLPGHCFGRPREELSLRLAFVDFDGGIALDHAAKGAIDDGFVERHCARVTDAIHRMAEWTPA